MFIKIAAPSNMAKDAVRSPVGPNCGAYLLDDLRTRFRQKLNKPTAPEISIDLTVCFRQNNKIIFLPETA
jgi:hypothetical protein